MVETIVQSIRDSNIMQSEIADLAGISSSTLSRVLAGKQQASNESLMRIQSAVALLSRAEMARQKVIQDSRG